MISQETLLNILGNILGPLVIGYVIWLLGKYDTDRRIKSDAIRDLMILRGDPLNPEFSRALNKISITFHDDQEIRKEIRELWEAINDPASREGYVKRKIVGLIYNLCKKKGFEGITEYDIDQAFPESKQAPTALGAELSGQPSTNNVKKRKRK